MSREDYLENEWSEELHEEAEPENDAPADNRSLYTLDTPPDEETEENEKVYSEVEDFLNAEDSAFRPIDDHRIYKMEEPPEIVTLAPMVRVRAWFS